MNWSLLLLGGRGSVSGMTYALVHGYCQVVGLVSAMTHALVQGLVSGMTLVH